VQGTPQKPQVHVHTHAHTYTHNNNNNNKDIIISPLQGFHLQINAGYSIDSENVFKNSPEFPVLNVKYLEQLSEAPVCSVKRKVQKLC
jgi:hypothetical protein